MTDLGSSHLRRLNDCDAPRLFEFLAHHAESSMFLTNNAKCSGLRFANGPYYGEYFGVFADNGAIAGVLAHYWNGNVLMQCPNTLALEPLLALFCEVIARPVTGVLGPSDQAELTINALNIPPSAFTLNKVEDLFELDLARLLKPEPANELTRELLPADSTDHKVLCSWLRGYEVEALERTDDDRMDAIIRTRLEQVLREAQLWVLHLGGTPVSMCGFNARVDGMVQIGRVWTPPEFRNRQYARITLAMTLEQSMADGIEKAILFADSPAAIKVYQALGFKKIGAYRVGLLREPLQPPAR